MNKTNSEIADSSWNSLYKISGVAAFSMMVFFLFDTICWIILGPYPSNAEGWFTLLQNNRIVGLLLLSFPTFFGMMLYYLTFFGLYGTLKDNELSFGIFGGIGTLIITYVIKGICR